jgi:hypothetical protein
MSYNLEKGDAARLVPERLAGWHGKKAGFIPTREKKGSVQT